MNALEVYVREAIKLTLGISYVTIYDMGKNKLKAGGDYEFSFAKEVYSSHIKSLHSSASAYSSSLITILPLTVTTTSELGITKERSYSSAKDVADSFIAALLEDDRVRTIVCHIHGDEKGLVTLTTKGHLEWHSIMGRLPCSVCGFFFKGQRGLRWHQVVNHGIEYECAQKEALTSDVQLIVYTAGKDVVRQWEEEARETKREKLSLGNEGLEAARDGDIERLRELICGGWNPHTCSDRHGSTPLIWAAGQGHLDVCKYLGDVCHVDVHALKGKAGMSRNALHWAARNGHIDVMKWLVEGKGVNVDVTTEDGTTALHFAVWNQQVEACKWLVEEAGCNLHILNSYGCNASQWCALNGNVEIMQYLKARGLDFGLLNNNGHSSLHKAALKGHSAACRWLLESEGGGGLGVPHMQSDSDGFTPMNFASFNGHEELGSFLQERYKDLMEKQREYCNGEGVV